MIGPLAHIAEAITRRRRQQLAAAQSSAVLFVLRERAGRLLSRAELVRLLPGVPKAELSSRLNSLEKAGLIVVDREERPVLYGARARAVA
jgi:DNA-binding HxlR family transcriptional regulator